MHNPPGPPLIRTYCHGAFPLYKPWDLPLQVFLYHLFSQQKGGVVVWATDIDFKMEVIEAPGHKTVFQRQFMR